MSSEAPTTGAVVLDRPAQRSGQLFDLPFDDKFLATNTSGSIAGKQTLAWAQQKPVYKTLRRFKKEMVDPKRINAFLCSHLGLDYENWPQILEDMLDFLIESSMDINETDAVNDALTTFLGFAQAIANIGGMPGYSAVARKPTASQSTEDVGIALAQNRYLLRTAGRLLLTVLKDLQEHPVNGYFATKLGGSPVISWKDAEVQQAAQKSSDTSVTDEQQKRKKRKRAGPRAGASRKKSRANNRLRRVEREKVHAGDDEESDENDWPLPLYSIYGDAAPNYGCVQEARASAREATTRNRARERGVTEVQVMRGDLEDELRRRGAQHGEAPDI